MSEQLTVHRFSTTFSDNAQNTDETPPPPYSPEAEQQLLGALLTRNELFDALADHLSGEHFYDPVHREIFDLIATRITKNTLASPVTLKPFLEDNEGLKELGGTAYLVRLAGSAISTFAVKDYAKIIRDMAIRRSLIVIGHDISDKACLMLDVSEPDQQIVEAEASLYQLAEKDKRNKGFTKLSKATARAVETAIASYKRGDGLVGLSTGLIDLDKKLGGLHPSDLIIIAGRPSMGKTALATNIGFNVAKNWNSENLEKKDKSGTVGFFSLEMSAEQLATRILSEISEIRSENIRRGMLKESEVRSFINASRELDGCPLYIDDTPALSIAQLRARARRLQRNNGLDLLVVDYLQLLQPDKATENRVIEIAKITQGLKAIAKELNIPVIALSQLSRQLESRDDKRPMLSDLRESGSIEQDADVVMFVYREEYYLGRKNPDEGNEKKFLEWKARMEEVAGKAEIIIGKQRHGPIGNVQLIFDKEYTRFANAVPEWQNKAYSDEF